MLFRFHGLNVVATEISFIWLWRKSRGVMAVAPGGDVVACCPQYQIPKEFLAGHNWRRKPRGKATRLNLLGKLRQSALRKLMKDFFGEKCMLFSTGNSISMGRWSEPRDLIGFQDEKINRLCDGREMSGEEKCASEDKELKGTLVWISSGGRKWIQ